MRKENRERARKREREKSKRKERRVEERGRKSLPSTIEKKKNERKMEISRKKNSILYLN